MDYEMARSRQERIQRDVALSRSGEVGKKVQVAQAEKREGAEGGLLFILAAIGASFLKQEEGRKNAYPKKGGGDGAAIST